MRFSFLTFCLQTHATLNNSIAFTFFDVLYRNLDLRYICVVVIFFFFFGGHCVFFIVLKKNKAKKSLLALVQNDGQPKPNRCNSSLHLLKHFCHILSASRISFTMVRFIELCTVHVYPRLQHHSLRITFLHFWDCFKLGMQQSVAC